MPLAALDQLRSEGVDVAETAHLSHALSAHVNPYGRYRFDVELTTEPAALRPLHVPGAPHGLGLRCMA